MRSHRAPRRGRGIFRALAVSLLILLCGAGATVGGLWYAGLVEWPWTAAAPVEAELPPGYVRVPLCIRDAPAGARLSREHLYDPRTLRPTYVPLSQQQVDENDVLLDPLDIVGRVLAREKRSGYSFAEADFLPRGTRPGMVSQIPPGKRSLTIEAARIEGVFGLNAGDHVDLVATVPIEAPRGGRNLGFLAQQAQAASAEKRAAVRVLAQDAVVVTAVTTRQKPITSSSLTQGTTARTVPVQEVVIAIDPDEVAAVTEALAMEAAITCVARTGQPGDPATEIDTTGADPLSEVRAVETIVGGRRETVVFPASDDSPPRVVEESPDIDGDAAQGQAAAAKESGA